VKPFDHHSIEAGETDRRDGLPPSDGIVRRSRRHRRRARRRSFYLERFVLWTDRELTQKGWNAMLQPSVKLSRVTVFFNPTSLLVPDVNPIYLWCDDFYVDQSVDGNAISIPQGITMIAFDLIQLPGGDPLIAPASFGTEPGNVESTITWFDPEDPDNPTSTAPAVFLVQSFSPSHCTVIDFNTVKTQNSHKFWVNVFYGGTPYNQDPTIINQPPMPVG
jgi:hypothetical protein